MVQLTARKSVNADVLIDGLVKKYTVKSDQWVYIRSLDSSRTTGTRATGATGRRRWRIRPLYVRMDS